MAMTPTPINQATIFQAHLARKTLETQQTYLRTVERLHTWVEQNELDIVQLKTIDLERFLAEEARLCSRATIRVRRSALRAFYESLKDAGSIEHSPADTLRLAAIDHVASTGPVEHLTGAEIARLREHALQLGTVPSLVICMLHETPASIRRVASLTISDLARNARHETYAILGQTPASKVPWRLSQQAVNAVDALQSPGPRLISPHTKNPNIMMIKAAVEQTRLSAEIQTPNLANALKHAHRRRRRELCDDLRVGPSSLLQYQRRLLDDLKPLQAHS